MPEHHDTVLELVADRRHGHGRQMLAYMLWRIEGNRALAVTLDLIEDADVAGHAMTSLRRMLGNEEARRRIVPLAASDSPDVRAQAQRALRRIDTALAKKR